MEWDFIECAVDGYFAACRDHGNIVPTIERLEQLALEITGRDTFDELDAGFTPGSVQSIIRRKYDEYLQSIQS